MDIKPVVPLAPTTPVRPVEREERERRERERPPGKGQREERPDTDHSGIDTYA